MKYNNIKIDHIFTIVSPDFSEKNFIKSNELIGHKTIHSGQGTTAEFIAFEENYLEFIWLSNKEEAKGNDLQLQQRFISKQCPFGFGFRGTIHDSHLEDFNVYKPDYLSEGRILEHKSQSKDYNIPMYFVMDQDREEKSFYPKNMNRFSNSKILTGGIKKIILHTPYLSPINNLFPQIEQIKSNTWKLQIIGLDEHDFSPLPIETTLKG